MIVLRSTAVVVESANWHLLMHLRTAKAGDSLGVSSSCSKPVSCVACVQTHYSSDCCSRVSSARTFWPVLCTPSLLVPACFCGAWALCVVCRPVTFFLFFFLTLDLLGILSARYFCLPLRAFQASIGESSLRTTNACSLAGLLPQVRDGGHFATHWNANYAGKC